jgi:hypothetical protein
MRSGNRSAQEFNTSSRLFGWRKAYLVTGSLSQLVGLGDESGHAYVII